MRKKCRPEKRISHIALCVLCLLLSFLFCTNASAAEKKATRWTIRQYGRGDASRQSMFYTIWSNAGELAVIDGGWKSDAGQVRDVIKKNGNVVNAWIITHPHPDHVGALVEILKNNRTKIKIRKIYTIPVDRKAYKKTKKWWDEYDVYDEFYHLTRKMKKVKYLKEKDELDLIGLKMKVFNSWDRSVSRLKVNLCNHGSLMFKLGGARKSMLFCSDIGKVRQKRLIRRYKKELSSTYVQCAHHGNWGLNKKFYRYVKPKIAFFDAPKMITDDTSGKYSAPSLIRYFKKRGVKVYTFANGNGKHTVKLS